MKILLATQKPFAAKAVAGIKEIAEGAGHEVVLLEKYAAQSDLVAAVADADAMIIRSDKVTAEVLDAAPKLRIVVRAGAGYDNVDLAAATAHGVVVMNTPGQNSNAVAELALAMMIFMARTQFTPATGSELLGKRLGVQAYGNVGRLVGRRPVPSAWRYPPSTRSSPMSRFPLPAPSPYTPSKNSTALPTTSPSISPPFPRP